MDWLGYNITDSMDMNLSKLWETVEDRGAWHAVAHGVAKNWTRLSNWTAIPLYEYTAISPSILLMMGIWDAPDFVYYK